MNANRILLAVIAAVAIFATPSVLTSLILAQTADDASSEALYQEFKTCLSTAEGTEGFASEDDIITCFTDAGYTQGLNDDNEDEDDNQDEDDGNDEENEDGDEETNN